jgi:chromate transporter
MTEEVDKSGSSQGQYLKDVFLCSLVAFGGPEAHLGVFYERLVAKKNYLSEKALMEWMALCSFLPGPTSTQVITGIGLERGGRSLALLTLLIWATPAILLMTALSFIPSVLSENGTIPVWLDFLAPMAAGFVAWAAWKLGRKVATDWLTILLWVVGATTPIFFHSAWAIPLAFLFGGLVGQLKRETETDKTAPLIRLRPPWIILLLFIGLTVLGIGGSLSSGSSLIEFLSGFGVVQAMPGPMFSFAAYAGGLCEQAGSATRQIAGALLGGCAIFLPGTLLLFFVHPFWARLQQAKWASHSLTGINAVAGGLVSGAFVLIALNLEWSKSAICFIALTLIFLAKKVPAPLFVILLLCLNLLLHWIQ